MHADVVKHFSTDPIMSQLVEEHGELDWSHDRVPFDALVESIVSQQLSVKAADTIYKRFLAIVGGEPLNANFILQTGADDLRGAGISYSKIRYIKEIAHASQNGALDLKVLEKLSDEEVITELTKIKGVGRWTAEMFLIFTLKRPDVFSVGDAGLRRAVVQLYGVSDKDMEQLQTITSKWSPYRSFASRYLWRSLDNK